MSSVQESDDDDHEGPPPKRARATARCSICKDTGHNRLRCPQRQRVPSPPPPPVGSPSDDEENSSSSDDDEEEEPAEDEEEDEAVPLITGEWVGYEMEEMAFNINDKGKREYDEDPSQVLPEFDARDCGPRNIPRHTESPLSFFFLFFTSLIRTMFVDATNSAAKRSEKKGMGRHGPKRV